MKGPKHQHSNASCGRATPQASARGSIFSNFETVQLSTDERVFLHTARIGTAVDLLYILKSSSDKLNINCLDYMGRNALHLAVDSENVDKIEILLEKVHMDNIEEALLHAISLGDVNIARIIANHIRYLCKDSQLRFSNTDPFFRTEEKYQYPPDVTPLILAAHYNDHEMIQMFLANGNKIDRPHLIHCPCEDCSWKQQTDSLKRSRSRLNAYKALSSPAYMALSSLDPITETFMLRQEMMTVASVEKEFQNEYRSLAEQCMNFACEMMDLCRGTQEVEAVLGKESNDPLTRLSEAIQFNEKKFVAHPNCQQHLTSIWYGKEMGFLQSTSSLKKTGLLLLTMPLLPFLCLAYIVNPHTKVARAMKCPVSKFVMHTISHFFFLVLLAAATFGLGEVFYGSDETGYFNNTSSCDSSTELRKLITLRPARNTITPSQILIIFWIVGLIWIECKQIYSSGAKEHFIQYYNYMDFSLLALYLASYSLRFVARYRVEQADAYFGGATAKMESAFKSNNWTAINETLELIRRDDDESRVYGYFMIASRFQWLPEDPEIISDILFAVANILSFARTTYVMPSHELLGPLQISLGRMLGDIARFVVLFLLVLIAFMVGMTNLYRYYGLHQIDNKPASESFHGLPQTVHTLFFSIFGLISLDKLKITTPTKVDCRLSSSSSPACPLTGNQKQTLVTDLPATTMDMITMYPFNETAKADTVVQTSPIHLGQITAEHADKSTPMVDRVGMVLFAIYQVAVTIVLVNMLIAMMSHSFEDIQGDNDMEWKFARTKLWMNYIDGGSTLPVPFNMIPTPKSCCSLFNFLKEYTKGDDDDDAPAQYDYTRRRGLLPADIDPISRALIEKKTTYADIIQRLVRRYLFKLDRAKREKEKVEKAGQQDYQDEEVLPEYQAEDEEREDRQRNPSVSSDLVAIDEELSVNIEKPIQATKAVSLGASYMPSSPPVLCEPEGADDLPRSSSSEAIRQITRRATMKRSAKRQSAQPSKIHPSVQVDAILRGQRMIDVRLQDIQSIAHSEDVSSNLTHVRHLLAESQKTLGSLVTVMYSLQTDVNGMSNVMSSVQKIVASDRGGRSKSALVVPEYHGKPKEKASHSKSNELPSGKDCLDPYLGQPVVLHVTAAKDKKQKRWNSIKKSLKRKKGGSGSDDMNPV